MLNNFPLNLCFFVKLYANDSYFQITLHKESYSHKRVETIVKYACYAKHKFIDAKEMDINNDYSK